MPDAHGVSQVADPRFDDPGAPMRNLLLAAALAVAACSHGSPKAVASHNAAGCLAACPGASVVETSPDGRMCRCWQHQAGMQYTFFYPDSEQLLEHSRALWEHNVGAATACKLQGFGWEPNEDGSDIICVTPESQLNKAMSKEPLKWTSVDEKQNPLDEKHGQRESVGSP